jgi:hypothetical protein
LFVRTPILIIGYYHNSTIVLECIIPCGKGRVNSESLWFLMDCRGAWLCRAPLQSIKTNWGLLRFGFFSAGNDHF